MHPHKNLYMNIHSSRFVTAIQWKQPKCLSTGEWKKQKVEYYLAKKRKWGTDTCYNANELQKYYFKWKKSDTKDNIFDFIFMEHQD